MKDKLDFETYLQILPGEHKSELPRKTILLSDIANQLLNYNRCGHSLPWSTILERYHGIEQHIRYLRKTTIISTDDGDNLADFAQNSVNYYFENLDPRISLLAYLEAMQMKHIADIANPFKRVICKVFSGKFYYISELRGYYPLINEIYCYAWEKAYFSQNDKEYINQRWNEAKEYLADYQDEMNTPILYHSNETEHVYFLYDPNNNQIKIGISKKPNNRIKNIKYGENRNNLVFLHIIPNGSRQLEKKLHDVFSEIRATGEWFHAEHELWYFIRMCIQNPGDSRLNSLDMHCEILYGFKVSNHLNKKS